MYNGRTYDHFGEISNEYRNMSLDEIPMSWIEHAQDYYTALVELEQSLNDPEESPFPPSDLIGADDDIPHPGRAVYYQAGMTPLFEF